MDGYYWRYIRRARNTTQLLVHRLPKAPEEVTQMRCQMCGWRTGCGKMGGEPRLGSQRDHKYTSMHIWHIEFLCSTSVLCKCCEGLLYSSHFRICWFSVSRENSPPWLRNSRLPKTKLASQKQTPWVSAGNFGVRLISPFIRLYFWGSYVTGGRGWLAINVFRGARFSADEAQRRSFTWRYRDRLVLWMIHLLLDVCNE